MAAEMMTKLASMDTAIRFGIRPSTNTRYDDRHAFVRCHLIEILRLISAAVRLQCVNPRYAQIVALKS